jgi:hypothetical protein
MSWNDRRVSLKTLYVQHQLSHPNVEEHDVRMGHPPQI